MAVNKRSSKGKQKEGASALEREEVTSTWGGARQGSGAPRKDGQPNKGKLKQKQAKIRAAEAGQNRSSAAAVEAPTAAKVAASASLERDYKKAKEVIAKLLDANDDYSITSCLKDLSTIYPERSSYGLLWQEYATKLFDWQSREEEGDPFEAPADQPACPPPPPPATLFTTRKRQKALAEAGENVSEAERAQQASDSDDEHHNTGPATEDDGFYGDSRSEEEQLQMEDDNENSRASLQKLRAANHKNVEEIVRKLITELKCKGIPRCYKDGSMWIRRPSAGFLLAQEHKPLPPFIDLLLSDVFLFLPDVLKQLTDRNRRDTSMRLACWNEGCCGQPHRAGYSHQPARDVAALVNYLILTPDYYCTVCKQTRRGTHSELVKQLPDRYQHEANQFILSARFGIDRDLGDLVRLSHHRGLGPEPFSKLLDELDKIRYDRMRLLYVREWERRHRKKIPGFERLPEIPPFFSDTKAPRPRVVSSTYLAAMERRAEEGYIDEHNQAMSLHTMQILQTDGSFKVPKATQGCVTALQTGMNEFGAVRFIAATPGKSLTHLTDLLSEVDKSNKAAGMPPLQLCYIDNPPGDGRYYESQLSDLTINVKHTRSPNTTGLPTAEIPHERVILAVDVQSMGFEARALLTDIRNGPHQYRMIVGLDTETSARRTGFGSGVEKLDSGISTIQIASSERVVVFQVCKLVIDGRGVLPADLIELLTDPNIVKVGREVQGDATKIKNLFNVETRGVRDLVFILNEQKIRPKSPGQDKLSDLTRYILGKYLEKDEALQLSDWQGVISAAQLNYAALDAEISRAIAVAAYELRCYGLFPKEPSESSCTIIVNGMSPIGECIIELWVPFGERVEIKAGSVTKTILSEKKAKDISQLCKVQVWTVNNQSWIPPEYEGQSLEAFGSVPFSLYIPSSLLRTRPKINRSNPPPSNNDFARSLASQLPAGSPRQLLSQKDISALLDEQMNQDAEDMSSGAEFVQGSSKDLSNVPSPSSSPLRNVADELDEEGDAIMQQQGSAANDPYAIATRILVDIFHALKSCLAAKAHSLATPFIRGLTDVVLRPVEEDYQRFEQVLKATTGETVEQAKERDRAAVNRRVRHYVPEAKELYQDLLKFFEAWENRYDEQCETDLFTKSTKEGIKRIIELARRGYLSDVHFYDPYILEGYDQHNLPLWKCRRGTNMLEGFHAWLIRCLTGFSSGPETLANFLSTFCYRWNMSVGYSHQHGVSWGSHYNIKLLNDVDDVYHRVFGRSAHPNYINGRHFAPTKERHGIIPFASEAAKRLNIEKVPSEEVRRDLSRLPPQQAYLCRALQIRLPLASVTSSQEMQKLFHTTLLALKNEIASKKSKGKGVELSLDTAEGRNAVFAKDLSSTQANTIAARMNAKATAHYHQPEVQRGMDCPLSYTTASFVITNFATMKLFWRRQQLMREDDRGQLQPLYRMTQYPERRLAQVPVNPPLRTLFQPKPTEVPLRNTPVARNAFGKQSHIPALIDQAASAGAASLATNTRSPRCCSVCLEYLTGNDAKKRGYYHEPDAAITALGGWMTEKQARSYCNRYPCKAGNNRPKCRYSALVSPTFLVSARKRK